MIKLFIEHLDNMAEISAFETTDGSFIEYIFNPRCDGHLNIGSESYRVKDGQCKIDASRIKEGEILATLVLPDGKIALPITVLANGECKIKDYDSDFIRKLSLDRLRMTDEIKKLRKSVDELSKRVYRTTIF